MVLYPTSVMRDERHIDGALRQWRRKGRADHSLMSCTPVYHRPYGLMKIGARGLLELNVPAGMKYYRKQDVPVVYRANGAIYVFPLDLIRARKINSQLFTDKTLAYVMSEEDGFEIDTETDFAVAEGLLGARLAAKRRGR
jgi:CMP-N-acetylneuraminic acid synthetase